MPLTIRDLEYLPEDGNRYELINGGLHISAPPTFIHQRVVRELLWEMLLFEKDHAIGEPMPGIGVIFDEFNSVIPDLVFYSNERADSIESDVGLTGAPEIAIEVLSPGSENENRDKKVKRTLYSENGVSEYWILDPGNCTVEIHRAGRTGGFETKAVLKEGDILTSSLLPGFECEVGRLFSPEQL